MQRSRGSRQQAYSQNGAYAQRQYRDEYEKPNAFLSVLLYLLTIISICFFICLIVLRSTGVSHVIRHTDVYVVLSDMFEGDYTYYIVNQVNGLGFHDEEITLQDVAVFIRTESVADEIGTIVDGYAAALIAGNHDHHVTVDEIMQMTRNLEPEFQEFFNYQMTEDDREHLAMTLDDVLDFDSLTIETIMDDYDIDLTIPLILISPLLLWSVGILCLLLSATIFVIRRGSPADGALAVGIAFTISGLIAFVAGIVVGTNPGVLGETAERYFWYLEYPVHLISQYGFFFAAIGVVTIIISLMVKKVSQKNRRA